MPTYEYQCEACNHEYSVVMTIAEYEKYQGSCPKCHSDQVKQLVSTFLTKTSRKS